MERVRLVKPVKKAKPERSQRKPPKVDPKIKTEDAIKALLETPGGKEIIEKIKKEGFSLPGAGK